MERPVLVLSPQAVQPARPAEQEAVQAVRLVVERLVVEALALEPMAAKMTSVYSSLRAWCTWCRRQILP